DRNHHDNRKTLLPGQYGSIPRLAEPAPVVEIGGKVETDGNPTDPRWQRSGNRPGIVAHQKVARLKVLRESEKRVVTVRAIAPRRDEQPDLVPLEPPGLRRHLSIDGLGQVEGQRLGLHDGSTSWA